MVHTTSGLVRMALTQVTKKGIFLVVYYPNEAVISIKEIDEIVKFKLIKDANQELQDEFILVINICSIKNSNYAQIKQDIEKLGLAVEYWRDGDYCLTF